MEKEDTHKSWELQKKKYKICNNNIVFVRCIKRARTVANKKDKYYSAKCIRGRAHVYSQIHTHNKFVVMRNEEKKRENIPKTFDRDDKEARWTKWNTNKKGTDVGTTTATVTKREIFKTPEENRSNVYASSRI